MEGLAVPRVLRAREAGAAAGLGDAGRPGRADAREPGGRAHAAALPAACRRRRSSAPGRGCRRPTSCAIRPEEIARHTRRAGRGSRPTRTRRWCRSSRMSERGTTAVMIYAPHRRHGFARATAVLDQLGLNILDASITPVGQRLFARLLSRARGGRHVRSPTPSAASRSSARCGARCSDPRRRRWRSRAAPRGRCACSSTPTQIAIAVDERNGRSVLELTAGDRPGLLCDVGKVLWEERVELHAAKISHARGARRGRVLRDRSLAAAALGAGGGETAGAAGGGAGPARAVEGADAKFRTRWVASAQGEIPIRRNAWAICGCSATAACRSAWPAAARPCRSSSMPRP